VSAVRGAALLLVLLLGGVAAAGAQTMGDYCYTPPSVGKSLPPNVMIVMDTSGSMLNFAYDYNGSGWSEGFDPTREYYGYFDPDTYYEYSSSVFQPVRTRSGSGDTASGAEWDGNFLNWLTMRRVDVARRVLTGGDYASNTLYAEGPDSGSRGFAKRADATTTPAVDPADYTPYADGEFGVYVQGSTPQIWSDITCNGGCSLSGDKYKVQVQVPSIPTGLLDEIWDDVRFGISFYDHSEGGVVSRSVDATTLSNFRSEVNEFTPDTWTPLAETLWTMGGYFAQADGYGGMPGVSSGPDPDYGDNRYSTGVQGKDPFWFSDHSQYASCAQNFVLYLTDGEPAQDGQIPSDLQDFDGDGNDTASDAYSDDISASDYFDDVAFYLRTTDLRGDLTGNQNMLLYPVFAFGQGSDLIKQAAMNGGFEDIDGDGEPYTSADCRLGQDNSAASAECDEWDADRDGVPDNYFEAPQGGNLETALRRAFTAILERASSGSTVATINTQTRSGGALLQAYYLPKDTKTGAAGTVDILWKGFLRSLWTDPLGNLREDHSPGDADLEPDTDRIVHFYFDDADQQVKAALYADNDGDHVPDTCQADATQTGIDVGPVWEAGAKLAERAPGTANSGVASTNRQIWFNAGDDSLSAFDADAGTASTLSPYWEPGTSGVVPDELIRYLRGLDNPAGNTSDYRLRQAADGATANYGTGSDEAVWKLGAVITSTPRVLRQAPVSSYAAHKDVYSSFYTSATVTDRESMAFFGANDGMLHAVYPGEVSGLERGDTGFPDVIAELTGANPGREAWAFMPENALPYLRWYGELDISCHVPTVDYRTQLIDAAVGSPAAGDVSADTMAAGDWRTLLIGTMGFGGQAIDCGDTDGDGSNDTHSGSVFVLDVTDPTSPTLLWERALPDDSLALTYPAVVRRADAASNDTNGDWYLVLGSGPLTPEADSFASSPQIYAYGLKDGSLAATRSVPNASGLAAGEPVPLDPDHDDITDTVYFGTYGAAGASDGGLYRLQFGDASTTVADWQVTQALQVDGSFGRPHFAAPGSALDPEGDLWLYGATGRNFNDSDTSSAQTHYAYGWVEDAWGDGHNDDAYQATPGTGTVTNLAKTDDIGVTATAVGRQCRCGRVLLSAPSYDSSSGTYSCPTGSELVVSEVEAVSYSGGSCGNGTVDCTDVGALRDSVKTAGGWYWDLAGDQRVFSQPSVRGGLVNILGFTPASDLCSFGGETTFHAADYRTGTAPPRPIFLNAAGFDTGTGSIATSFDLGAGVPPLGEGFAAMPGAEEGQVGQLTQTSTGQVSGTTQQSQGLRSGILFRRER
jgi:type IV pilus assembly protein PilY1